jgi:CitMHS family citrate-Mg2+:H+ or citrate-Ca2+:H+ symporter
MEDVMYLALLGYALVTIMILGLLKGKLIPLVAFCLLPPAFGLLAGYNMKELSEFVVKGVRGSLNAAALVFFSTTYFGIMTKQGLFDPAVNFLSKKVGGNVVAIAVITSLIAAISHMDTGMTSTMLVTIPAMLPIYKRFNMRLELLFLLVAQSVAVINLLPHGGGMVRMSSVTGLDVSLMFRTLVPIIIIMVVYNMGMAVFLGMKEKRRLTAIGAAVGAVTLEESNGVQMETKINIRYFINLVLTIIILVLMFLNLFPSYFIFMMGMAIALIVNYRTTKEQNDALKNFAGNAYPIGIIMLASGILVGIMGETGMLGEMANLIIRLIPRVLKPFFSIIVGFLSIPLSLVLGADGFYFGMTPLFTEVGSAYGISTLSIVSIMMLARDAMGCITPVSAVTYLAPGLLGIELKDLIRFSFKYLFFFFCIETVLAVILKVIPFIS